jgi:murein DD-endopeptidase MepM/ murein hydrolase activator NlpD
VAALIIVAFFIIQSVLDRDGGQAQTEALEAPEVAAETAELSAGEGLTIQSEESGNVKPAPAPVPAVDYQAIAYPYDEYWLTQGPHGFSYGHMAIDLAAGKGASIKSPIHGEITGNYVDQYGNTTLIIENDYYVVTLLHGNYSAQVGEKVSLGQLVGSEGNNGYTTDMQGFSCRNRDCGYHSHLNVFSKISQTNVNPLTVLK